MNILFINSISPRKLGGGEMWMIKAAKGLGEAGHTVYLACKPGSKIVKAAEKAGIQTRLFNIRSDFSPITTLRITSFLQKKKIDILICNLNKDVRVAGLAGRLAKRPIIIARHGVLLCGKKWKHKFTLKRLADGILTNTETIRSAYQEYGWFDDDFVKVIHNGIEEKPAVQPYDFTRRFPGKKIIFSAGRLSEQKGFAYLIQAAAHLVERRQDLVFVVAGTGRLENKLKNLVKKYGIEDTFQLFGYLDDIDPYIKGCDLFVLTSLFEGMPNVVMEAMASGKAVIATDVNGVRELVVDGETGVIVPPKKIETLAEAIDSLVDDGPLRDRYGRNGLERVREHFTVSEMIKRLEEYFTGKINERAKSVK